MPPFNTVIIHNGQFHADEVLSVALLSLLGYDFALIRTNSVAESCLNDPACLVLDIGRRLEPELGNFDHHQDKDIPATNLLILEHFGRPILGDRVTAQLRESFFNRVSDVDRGLVVITGPRLLEFNMIIRAFNTLENGFDKAREVAIDILMAQIKTCQKAIQDELRWKDLLKEGAIAYQEDTDPILGWKAEAEKEGVLVLVCPNLRGGYSIISRDTAILQIPAHADQTFLHASGFMATYPSWEQARAHARELVNLPYQLLTD